MKKGDIYAYHPGNVGKQTWKLSSAYFMDLGLNCRQPMMLCRVMRNRGIFVMSGDFTLLNLTAQIQSSQVSQRVNES